MERRRVSRSAWVVLAILAATVMVGALLLVLRDLPTASAPSSQPEPATPRAAPTPTPTPTPTPEPDDVRQIYPTAEGGQVWYGDWSGGEILDDPWLQIGSRDIRYDLEDDQLLITGGVHRLYVRDPDFERQWGDVEITTYFKRVADDDIPYSGMVATARTNHGTTGNTRVDSCDSRGLHARLRNDGVVDFGKEVKDPNTVPTGGKVLWPNGLPRDVWIGFKHVVYDTDDSVVQEVWIDESGGADDAAWVKVASHVDPFSGSTWGAGQEPCAPGIDPAAALTNDPAREGSESGLPNLSVYFRADGMWKNGLIYKDTSVREINVEQ